MPQEFKTITLQNSAYSPLLRQISDPPELLYYRGNIELLHHPHLLAVVGSRKADAYGKAAATKLLPPFVSAGGILVSGLAFGIDSLAHRACLEQKRPTIAVLGSGLDDASIGPRSNLPLAHHILKNNGLILSEYPPGTPGSKHRYPERNRVIAGLCPATLIIQASNHSGSLITARLALEGGRDVLAVPGPITSTLSAGTNNLIQQGATPATNPEELLALYHLDQNQPDQKTDHQLTTEQAHVMQALASTPLDINDLCQKTNLSASIVSPLLIELELLDLVQNVGSARYIKR